MNNWLSIICLTSVAFCCQAETKLSSTIKEVTVYNDRAAVTRHAQIQLSAGEYELVFENLPNALENQSLQLDVKATEAVIIQDININHHYLVSNANERLRVVEQEIKVLQEKLAQVDDQETLLVNQKNFIDQAQKSTVGEDSRANRPSLEQVQQIMDFSSVSLAKLSEETRQLSTEKEQLQKQLQVLKDNQTLLFDETQSQVKDVTVKVNVPKTEMVKVNLTYVTYGASWTPIYDARFSSKEQKLSLNYLANVAQQTGEDWQGVKLTLSTAKPSLSGTVPELKPWTVAQYNERVLVSPRDSRVQYKAARAEMSSKKPKPAFTPKASISPSLTNTAFTIAEPTTLLSGSDEQKVMIYSRDNLQADLVYQTVPRLKEVALLQATTKNNSDYPLLAGVLNIFMDGRFISRGTLGITMPNDTLKVGLGVDEGVKVTFKQLKRFTEKTGFTNSGERITYDYLLTVQNNKNKPIALAIADHIPVSQNEKIKVKLLSPNTIQADKEGKISWNITLNPMEKREIPIKFTVDYPVNTQVIGL